MSEVKEDNYELYNGDCLEEMKKIPDGSVDLVLVDPPYGTTSNKWDSVIPFEKLWPELNRITKEVSSVVMTASQPFTSVLIMSNIEQFKHEWIWQKNRGSNFLNTMREPMKEHESVICFSKGKWTFNRQMQQRTGSGADRVKYKLNWDSHSENYQELEGRENQTASDERVPSSIQKFNVVSGKEKVKHPTQKPIDLMEYLIKTYSNEGDTVIDFTMGSGSTGVACMNLERKFIGIELDKEYFDVALTRIEKSNIVRLPI